MIGEDLVVGLLELYLRENGDALREKPEHRCTGGGNAGPRLDAWLLTKNALYQAEIKNWCASAIGGVGVDDENNPPKESKGRSRKKYTWLDAAIHNHERYLKHKETAKKVWKVLVKMSPPRAFSRKKPKPLLAFWSPVAPMNAESTKDLVPFFKLPTEPFNEVIASTGWDLPKPYSEHVWVFSASNYLRGKKGEEYFNIQMPRVYERLGHLQKFGFPVEL